MLAILEKVNPSAVKWDVVWAAIAAIAAVLALLWAIWEHAGRRKAERKLDEIKRRGDAPFLSVSDAILGTIHYFRNGGTEFWHAATTPGILSFQQERVGALNAGDQVVLLVDNTGEPTHKIAVKLDDIPIVFDSGRDFQNPNATIFFLLYLYDPQKNGHQQRITVAFETRSGVHDTHTYITRHGVRFLKRIDPALPQ